MIRQRDWNFLHDRILPIHHYENRLLQSETVQRTSFLGVKLNFALAISLICPLRAINVCQDCQPFPHGWQNPVEQSSFQTPLRYKIGRVYWAPFLRRRVCGTYFHFNAIFHRWYGRSSSNGMIQEKLGATVWSNATHTSAPAIMGSKKSQGNNLRFWSANRTGKSKRS